MVFVLVFSYLHPRIIIMGGHGHDHGHHAPYTVPKACIYKIENAKPLLEVQEALARKGLKDPWARFVWTLFNVAQIYSTYNILLFI